MAKNIEKIATGLGAKVIGQVPDTGGGAFGAARLAGIVGAMRLATIQAAQEGIASIEHGDALALTIRLTGEEHSINEGGSHD